MAALLPLCASGLLSPSTPLAQAFPQIQVSFLLSYPGPGSLQRLQKDQRSWGRGQPGVCGRAAAVRERPVPQRAVAAPRLDHSLLCLPLAGVLGRGPWDLS